MWRSVETRFGGAHFYGSNQVQELRCLKRLRSIIHNYLGGRRHYTMYGREVDVAAKALRDKLGCIALTIFAKTSDVVDGVFAVTDLWVNGKVSQGLNMGLFRAGNKGGICLPFRFHNCHIAVMAVHLPADTSLGSSAARRNEALQELFHAASGEDFDVHLSYHHTIFFGE